MTSLCRNGWVKMQLYIVKGVTHCHSKYILCQQSREVSKKILRSSFKCEDDAYSQLLVEWGQYIDHDITFTPQSTANTAFWTGQDCLNTCENVHPCFPIEVNQKHNRLSAFCLLLSCFFTSYNPVFQSITLVFILFLAES